MSSSIAFIAHPSGRTCNACRGLRTDGGHACTSYECCGPCPECDGTGEALADEASFEDNGCAGCLTASERFPCLKHGCTARCIAHRAAWESEATT